MRIGCPLHSIYIYILYNILSQKILLVYHTSDLFMFARLQYYIPCNPYNPYPPRTISCLAPIRPRAPWYPAPPSGPVAWPADGWTSWTAPGFALGKSISGSMWKLLLSIYMYTAYIYTYTVYIYIYYTLYCMYRYMCLSDPEWWDSHVWHPNGMGRLWECHGMSPHWGSL